MTDTKVDVRSKRVCHECGLFDDHPRHVIGVQFVNGPATVTPEALDGLRKSVDLASEDGAQAMAGLYDPTVVLRHMDCCRTVGCPDGSCNTITSGAEELRGSDLLDHLLKGAK